MTDYYELLQDALNALRRNAQEAALLDPKLAGWLLKKHEAWGNSSAGVALGYNLEAEKSLKYLKKGREVGSDRGDITTFSGRFSRTDSKQGKVLQLKHTLCKSPGAVDRAIRKAIIQISGYTKEEPDEDDRVVIEIVISNMENTWPLKSALGRSWVEWESAYSLKLFEEEVRLKLARLSENGKIWPVKWKGKAGLAARKIDRGIYREKPEIATQFESYFKKNKLGTETFVALNSRSVVSDTLKKMTNGRKKKIDPERFIPIPGRAEFSTSSHLMIKIIFSTGRRFKLSEGNEMILEKVVIAARWNPGDFLKAHVVKVKPV